MSTDVDAPPGGSGPASPPPSPRRGRQYRWYAVLAVLATVVTAVALKAVASGSDPAPPGAQQVPQGAPVMPEALRTQVAARLVAALESGTPAEQHNHGHQVATGGKVVCAVDAIGVDPAGATDLGQVTTVYALHLCAVAEPGRDWDLSIRYSGPLAATLGDRPVISVVQAGEGYPQRVQAMIPERYRDRATGPFTDERALAELRRRFTAAQH
jgi:hypothetical protein